MGQMTNEEKLIAAASNAANTILAFYVFVDRIEKVGGTTSLSGIAACHAMIESMKKNRSRLDKLIIDPINEVIAERAK
jgi:hypothetical protein